jgi:hypothetical protein
MFPLLPKPLTPITGHFEQGFFVADSTINTNDAEPLDDANNITKMETQMLSSFHLVKK